MRWFPWSVVLSTLAITGCTSMCGVKHATMSPEQVVEAYLDLALNMHDVSERDGLLEYTTGNLKNAIASASPETIKTAYVDRKYHIVNYSVVERRDRTPREVEVTFQLTYNDLGADAKPKDMASAPKVTTENTVAVVKENGLWLVRDVLGNKTSIDFPVSEESRITAKAGPGVDTPDDQPGAPDEDDDADGPASSPAP